MNSSSIIDPNYKPTVILDSGAYSAWRQGKEIDVAEYADYICDNFDHIHEYVNLDVICPEDRESGAERGWKNFLYLRDQRNLDPIPVFHQGEDMRWLDKMLDSGVQYIALSGNSTLRSASKILEWYDIVWNRLVNSGGLPSILVHGLADTTSTSLKIYPWNSVDSSSWGQAAGRGVFHVLGPNGKRTFGQRKDGISDSQVTDVLHLTEEDKEFLHDTLAPFNVDVASLVNRNGFKEYSLRLMLCALYYRNLEKSLHTPEGRKLRRNRGFFSLGVGTGEADGIIIPAPKIYLAVWANDRFYTALRDLNYKNILISYWFIRIAAPISELPYANAFLGKF